MKKVVKDYQLPFEYASHLGRTTITTLAMMSQNENGQQMIPMEHLEYNNHWVRGTKVLSTYLADNAAFAKTSIMNKFKAIRDNDQERNLDEEAIKNVSRRPKKPTSKVAQFLKKHL